MWFRCQWVGLYLSVNLPVDEFVRCSLPEAAQGHAPEQTSESHVAHDRFSFTRPQSHMCTEIALRACEGARLKETHRKGEL